jgi:hypothetical protein
MRETPAAKPITTQEAEILELATTRSAVENGGVRRQWPHWLALAAVTVFFARK